MPNNLNLHQYVWLPQPGATHTVVALHGTGGDENDLVPLVRQLYPASNILGIRGNVSENGYPRFFRRYMEGMFDEADINARTADLETFWNAAAEAYNLSPATTTWLGYSNGANMIAAMLWRNDTVRDAVLIRAQAPFKDTTVTKAEHAATVKLLSGAYDTIVPVTESARLRDVLTARGHTVDHRILDTGHQLSRMDVEILTDPKAA